MVDTLLQWRKPEDLQQPNNVDIQGNFAKLRAVLPSDAEQLYKICVLDESSIRWRFRGIIPPFEAFVQSLRNPDVHMQFVIADPSNNAPIGMAISYSADPRNRYSYVGIVVDPALQGGGVGVDAAIVFCRYLFQCWPFQKLYMDVVEYNLKSFESAVGTFLKIEGLLKEHTYFDGKNWDNYILALYRHDFERIQTIGKVDE